MPSPSHRVRPSSDNAAPLLSARTTKPSPVLPGGYRPKSLVRRSAITPELISALGFPSEYAHPPTRVPRTLRPYKGDSFEAPALRSATTTMPHGWFRIARKPIVLTLPKVRLSFAPVDVTLPRLSFALAPQKSSVHPGTRLAMHQPSFVVRRPPLVLHWPRVRLRPVDVWFSLRPLRNLALGFVAVSGIFMLTMQVRSAYWGAAQVHQQSQHMLQRVAEATARVSYLEGETRHLKRSLRSLEAEDRRLKILLAITAPEGTVGLTTSTALLSSIPSLDPSSGGELTSGFGWRTTPWPEFHRGLDLAQPEGHPVLASADGVVGSAGWYGGFGKMIDINHNNGFHTLYGHLSRIDVHLGQHVWRGQVIAAVGQTGEATGPHLHYQIMRRGDPVDPTPFMHGIPSWAFVNRH